jgi:hypothetical protein
MRAASRTPHAYRVVLGTQVIATLDELVAALDDLLRSSSF